MFNSVNQSLNRGQQEEKDKTALQREAKQFSLPGEGVPQVIKYAFFFGLAFLNFRLFNHTIPGGWGVATGVAAMLVEALGLYCLHNFSRAAGLFRMVLGLCGLALTAFSVAHGIASVLDMIGVAEISEWVQWYSHAVAFPLLAVLLGASAIAITMTHPNNIIRLKQSVAHTEIATGRAETASELELMRARSILERSKLDNARERSRLEGEYLEELEKLARIEERKRKLVASLSDDDLRDQVARELGIKDGQRTSLRPAYGQSRPAIGYRPDEQDSIEGDREGYRPQGK